LGDVLRLPKRHPAWRRREAQSGSCAERENLAGDAKGKGTSGSNREAESTDAPERGGLLRSKYPPAEPGALGCEPLKAAVGVADAAPARVGHLKVACQRHRFI